MPPLGFDKTYTVMFLDQNAMFATASTCDLKLRLPVKFGEDIAKMLQGSHDYVTKRQ